MTLMDTVKNTLEDIFICADEYVCRLLEEMTWGLGTLLVLSALWLCFG